MSINRPKYKYQMYKQLQLNRENVIAEARKAADEIGIPKELRGKFGLTGAVSGVPALLTNDVMDAVREASKKVIPLADLVDEYREIVKDVHGDDWDVAPISTCEAALWVTYDVLFSPPMLGRGENYRCRYIAPYERHMHHQAGYGRPFPPRYKAYISNRGVTAGELGMEGKRQLNTDCTIVPLAGARYEAHGLRYSVCPLLVGVDPEASVERMAEVAERYVSDLVGFASLGYDTPGYGYGAKDSEGTPQMLKNIGNLAERYGVPYVVDNAWGTPLPVGTDPRKIKADVIMYSMDKAVHAPTSGLIIGKDDAMIPIRQALGMGGNRWGTVSSYGKAQYVTNDPGKNAIVGQMVILKTLRDEPKRITDPVDDTLRIVEEEFEEFPSKFRDDIIVTKSYNSNCVEINYERTWKEGELGIPIFGIEDMYAGSDLYIGGLKTMGILPTIFYDANIMVSPGLGTTDEEGQLIEERMRYAIKGAVKILEIVCKYAGVLEMLEIRA